MTTRRPIRGRAEPPVRFAGLVASVGRFVALLAAVAVVSSLLAEILTGSTPIPGLPSPSVTVRWGIPVVRVLLDVTVVATMGLALLAKFLGFDDPDRTEPVMTRVRRLAVWASWAWVGTALLSLVLVSAEVYPDRFPTRTTAALDVVTAPLSIVQYAVSSPTLIWDYVRAVPAGKGLVVVAGLGLLSVWLCRISVRRGESVPAELRAGVAAFGLLPLPLTGHASSWIFHDLVMMSMELHLIAAAAWAGGLGATIVFLARRPALLAVALPRYSRLATYCVFVVGISGLLSGIATLATSDLEVPLPDSIWSTHYGQLLLAKLVCIGIVAMIALRVRRGMLARIAQRAPTPVAFWCGFELLVMAAAYGIAVVLTRSAPY